MFLSFKAYVKTSKRYFRECYYDCDIHYRAVLFHQFGESFRWYCKRKQIANDYDEIAYEVAMFEKRLERYHNA